MSEGPRYSQQHGRDVRVFERFGPAIWAPQAALIDFDRTVASVSATSAYFRHGLLELFPALVDIPTMTRRQQRIEAAGRSFSPTQYVIEQLGEAAGRKVIDACYNRPADPAQQYPDVAPFQRRLQAGGMPHTLFSYSVDIPGQRRKIAAAGTGLGMLVTNEKYKGRVAPSFFFDGQGYRFAASGNMRDPYFVTDSVVLIDDKPCSFDHWPGAGFCLQRPDEETSAKALATLRPDIAVISSLDELVVWQGRVVHRESYEGWLSRRQQLGRQTVAFATEVVPIVRQSWLQHVDTDIGVWEPDSRPGLLQAV